MAMRVKNSEVVAGKRLGRLVVVERYPWGQCLCRCDCGVEKTFYRASLLRGAESCGCLRADGRRSHGKSKTSEYNVYKMMLQRCYNPNHDSYVNYGERGIGVCERWRGRGGFENFLADMGPRPSRRHMVERKDNDSGYSPENCVWAVPATQMRNTRRTVHVTYAGRTMCVTDWAKEIGVPATTLAYRVRHWPLEKAMRKIPTRTGELSS